MSSNTVIKGDPLWITVAQSVSKLPIHEIWKRMIENDSLKWHENTVMLNTTVPRHKPTQLKDSEFLADVF